MVRKQKGFLFDPNRCLGCRACIMACAAGKDLPPGIYLRHVELQEFRKGEQIIQYFHSISCNHCINPECLRLCPEQAYRKRRDGIVLHDLSQCNGCGDCTRSCPFEAPIVNPVTGKAVKCDLCYDKLDEEEIPYCVAACPVQALRQIDLWDLKSQAPDTVQRLYGIIKLQITRPSIRYISLKPGRQILRNPVRKGDEYENGNL